jgi:general secretion pathway protein H
LHKERAGFTLIELTIALAIAAMVTTVTMSGLNAMTGASLRSSAIELTGAIKMNYDRAVMLKRTQRLVMDLDQGLWWVEFNEDRFALTQARAEGKAGDSSEKKDKKKSIFDDDSSSIFDDEVDQEVKKAMAGAAMANFSADDVSGGKRQALPSGTCFSRIWTEHQEEAFTEGVAYLHFFPGGWTEPARIELVDSDCKNKEDPTTDQEGDYKTLKIFPLTGRVRSYNRKLELPDTRERGEEDDN